MGINEQRNFFDMKYMTEVVPGFINDFTIKATETVADIGIKSNLSPLERNCRFNDELPENMTIFKKYSQAACKFECMVSIRYLNLVKHFSKILIYL